MGGMSAEREVSLKTGGAVLEALLSCGCNAFGIDVDKDLPEQLHAKQAEQAFICLHGRYGEDGAVQGLLEMMQIPYTGSGVLSSSVAMDKVMTKKIMIYHNVATPDFTVFCAGEDPYEFIEKCQSFPKVVKPSREGSTIGITIANDKHQLFKGLKEASQHDNLILVEDYIQGDELTVSVLNGRPLPIIKIIPKSGFYDYTSKYTPGQTQYILPAPLPKGVYKNLQTTSVDICRALYCRGACRVDFMMQEDNYYCLEVNTIPGMTETSLLPKAAAEADITFNELVMEILMDVALNK